MQLIYLSLQYKYIFWYGNPIFVLCRVNFMLYPCCEILHEWFIVSCLTLVLSTDSDFCYKLIPPHQNMMGMRCVCVSLSFYYDCVFRLGDCDLMTIFWKVLHFFSFFLFFLFKSKIIFKIHLFHKPYNFWFGWLVEIK